MLKELNTIAIGLLGLHGYPSVPFGCCDCFGRGRGGTVSQTVSAAPEARHPPRAVDGQAPRGAATSKPPLRFWSRA